MTAGILGWAAGNVRFFVCRVLNRSVGSSAVFELLRKFRHVENRARLEFIFFWLRKGLLRHKVCSLRVEAIFIQNGHVPCLTIFNESELTSLLISGLESQVRIKNRA